MKLYQIVFYNDVFTSVRNSNEVALPIGELRDYRLFEKKETAETYAERHVANVRHTIEDLRHLKECDYYLRTEKELRLVLLRQELMADSPYLQYRIEERSTIK